MALRIPSVARESTSAIVLEFLAVSSSSSLTRPRTGSSWRFTYFLRAKGFILPQKPSWRSYLSGSLPVAGRAFGLGVGCFAAPAVGGVGWWVDSAPAAGLADW